MVFLAESVNIEKKLLFSDFIMIDLGIENIYVSKIVITCFGCIDHLPLFCGMWYVCHISVIHDNVYH